MVEAIDIANLESYVKKYSIDKKWNLFELTGILHSIALKLDMDAHIIAYKMRGIL